MSCAFHCRERTLAMCKSWLPQVGRGDPQAPPRYLEASLHLHPRERRRCHALACPRARSERQADRNRAPLRISPTLTTNNGEVARRWCEQGLGLVLRSEWDAAPAVSDGRLERLLPEWSFSEARILALTPERTGISTRVSALLGFLQRAFSPIPPWRPRR